MELKSKRSIKSKTLEELRHDYNFIITKYPPRSNDIDDIKEIVAINKSTGKIDAGLHARPHHIENVWTHDHAKGQGLCRAMIRIALQESRHILTQYPMDLTNQSNPISAGCTCYLDGAAQEGIFAYGNFAKTGDFNSNRYCLSKLASEPEDIRAKCNPASSYARGQILYSDHELTEKERCQDRPEMAAWDRRIESMISAPEELREFVGNYRDAKEKLDDNGFTTIPSSSYSTAVDDFNRATLELSLGGKILTKEEIKLLSLSGNSDLNDSSGYEHWIEEANTCSSHQNQEKCLSSGCEWLSLAMGQGNCILSNERRKEYKKFISSYQ